MKKINLNELNIGSKREEVMVKTSIEIEEAINLNEAVIVIEDGEGYYKIEDIKKDYELKIFNLDNAEMVTKEELIKLKDDKKIYIFKSEKVLDEDEKKKVLEKILTIVVSERIDFTKRKLKIFN